MSIVIGKRIIFGVLFVLMSGCATVTNPLSVSEEDAAFLRNRYFTEGEAALALNFRAVDGVRFSAGSQHAPQELTYTIPSGGCELVIYLYYRPSKIAIRRYERLARIHLDAQAGKTYQANVAINEQENHIELWIEDMAGNRASKTLSAELGKPASAGSHLWDALPALISVP